MDERKTKEYERLKISVIFIDGDPICASASSGDDLEWDWVN